MPREKLIASHMDISSISSFNSVSGHHELLGADHKQIPEAQATSINAGLLIAMLPCWEGSIHGGMYKLGSMLPSGSLAI